LVRYTRDAFYALRDGRRSYYFLIVGVYMTFVILFSQRIWAISLDIYGRADDMVNSPVSPFISLMAALVSWL